MNVDADGVGGGSRSERPASRPALMSASARWWTEAVFYQVYPRSFQDGNGDGVGDLEGATKRLEYLAWLGVDAVWLSPIYQSPMDDFGYDITNHEDVDPVFGTLADFDRLLAEAHRLGLKVVMDYVPNHTSAQHPWFIESRRSRSAVHRDWYIWRDGQRGGIPPNNWRRNGYTHLPGSAWTLDAHTGQYYLASFSERQPDLNWENPAVRAALLGVLRFWLERGVDGFRIDMLDFLGKDPDMRDEPPRAPDLHYYSHATRQLCRERSLRHLADIRTTVAAFPDRVLIGEIAYLAPLPSLVSFYGEAESLLDLPFNARLMMLPYRADVIADFVDEYDSALVAASATGHGMAWPNYTLGNHDIPRIGRLGDQRVRLMMLLLLTLRGTPFVYYGDELGMPDVAVPPERRQDPHPTLENPNGRDSCRTPMQWDARAHAGFSDAEPWLPVDPGYRSRNVEQAAADSSSTLRFVRDLIALRRGSTALRRGDYRRLSAPPGVFVYERCCGAERLVVALNFAKESAHVEILEGCSPVMSTTALPPLPGSGPAHLPGGAGVCCRAPLDL